MPDVIVAPDRLTNPEPAVAMAVPPQVLLNAFGVATTRPAGRLSVNAMPVSVKPMFGLLMLKVSDVVPFNGMLAAPNALVIVGGLATVRTAVAVLPVPPFVDETLLVVLTLVPDEMAVTLTVTVQLLLTAMVPADNVTLPEPAVAVTEPPQALVNAFGVATTSPAGRLSVNAMPLSATLLLGLVIVRVRLVVPFKGMVPAPNDLAIDGGVTTMTLADAVPPGPLSVAVTWLVVLFFTPAVVPVTLIENWHWAFCGMVAPAKETEPLPATAVIVPIPQLPARPFGVDTTRPAGRLSVKPIPVRLAVALLF